jgi:hypothetical protein
MPRLFKGLLFILPARKKLTECILLSQGACFRENCKYSHAHAEGLGAQLPQVCVSYEFFCFLRQQKTTTEPNF